MRISAAVQHHPLRGALLPGLLEQLAPLEAEVVEDPDADAAQRNPWRTYLEALRRTPGWATHRLIIQDDATPCPLFAEALGLAVAARPDRPLVLCVCGDVSTASISVRHAADRGRSWADVNARRYPGAYLPAVAVVWPAEQARSLVAWAEGREFRPQERCDDALLGEACAALSLRPCATVPSLVEHRDLEPSVVNAKRTTLGRSPVRTTMLPVPEGHDAREIDWTIG